MEKGAFILTSVGFIFAGAAIVGGLVGLGWAILIVGSLMFLAYPVM